MSGMYSDDDAGEGGNRTHPPGSLRLWRSSQCPGACFVLSLSSFKERQTVGGATETDC